MIILQKKWHPPRKIYSYAWLDTDKVYKSEYAAKQAITALLPEEYRIKPKPSQLAPPWIIKLRTRIKTLGLKICTLYRDTRVWLI